MSKQVDPKQREKELQSVLSGFVLSKPEQEVKKEVVAKPQSTAPAFMMMAPSSKQSSNLFKDIPEWRIQAEFQKKVASECSRRCLMHRLPKATETTQNYRLPDREDELTPNYSGIKISQSEQLCLNRCISKLAYVKEIVDSKIGLEHV